MQLILNNPNRRVGLFVGATAKEFQKQVNKLKMYVSAEQEIPLDLVRFGFDCLGKVNRSDIN